MIRVGEVHSKAVRPAAVRAPRIVLNQVSFRNKALIYWDPSVPGKTRDAIDTDQIIPSEHCVSGDMRDLWKPWGEHVFAHMDPEFRAKVGSGQTFVVAGENFGIGSSREMAPAGLLRAAKDMGQEDKLVIVAKSFGAIFRKNAINLGLHICECPQAVEDAKEGDEFEFDPVSRKLTNLTQGKSYQPKALTSQEEAIRLGGGLVGGAKADFRKARRRIADTTAIAARFPDGAQADRMSVAEQILYAHRVDLTSMVAPGQTVRVFTDLLPASDGTAPFAISVFLEVVGRARAAFPWGAAIVNDHFFPCVSSEEEAQYRLGEEFAKKFGLKPPYYTEPQSGIFHFHFPYSGLVKPGMLIAGADSHTCTYGAYGAFATGVGSTELGVGWALKEVPITFSHNRRVVFGGSLPPWVTGKDIVLNLLRQWGIKGVAGASIDMSDPQQRLSMAARHTIANMAVEGNALSAIFPQDEITAAFFEERHAWTLPYPRLTPGPNVQYQANEEVDLAGLAPLVARPFHPSNSVPARELSKEKVRITQAYLGSCTNGNYDDMLAAAFVLAASGAQKIANRVRMLVFPGNMAVVEKMATPEPLLDNHSIVQLMRKMGVEVRLPACAHCFKPTADSPAPGEAVVSTTNRNWKNRQGSGVETYLAGPFVVTASAVLGHIGTPEDLGISWEDKFRI